MNQSQKFTEDDIPYNILNRFGFTREMIEDMPDAILKKLKDGHTTPVLPIQVTADNGDKILSAARISLYRNESGEVRVMFYPKLEKAELSRFSPLQQKSLNDGEPIVSDMTMPDGKKAPAFFQIDHETNQVMSVPVAVIDNNIKFIADELHLSQPEVNCIRNGKLIAADYQDTQWTLGVSLNEASGIRVVAGDENAWRDEERREYGKFNFGLNGCWIANDEGGLDYVPEEEYSEVLWDEMKKRGNQLRNAGTHKM